MVGPFKVNSLKKIPLSYLRLRKDIASLAVTYDPSILPALLQLPGLALPPHLTKAAKGRQLEYLLGRALAGHLLEEIGLPCHYPGSIGRRPVWPSGVKGAITHTDSLVACSLSSNSKIKGLGIDCEKILEDGRFNKMRRHVFTALDEQFKDHNGWPIGRLGALVFSAKESLYKALYPQFEVFFGLRDAALVALDDGVLKLQLQKDLSCGYSKGRAFLCQYEFFQEKVFTQIVDEDC